MDKELRFGDAGDTHRIAAAATCDPSFRTWGILAMHVTENARAHRYYSVSRYTSVTILAVPFLVVTTTS